ncbi:MAG: hypothetical protein M3P27_09505 [Acidobacteriota bacterium]|nr:hypothetical protein [Acidobacteriota bacterium]
MRTTVPAIILCILCAACLAQAQAKKPNPADGAVTAGVYQNNYFGFEYKLPTGFTDRTSAMPQNGAGISYGLLHASEPKSATKVASSVTLFADDAAYWKSKNGAEYLDKVSAR